MNRSDQTGLLSVEQALDELLNAATPTQQSEKVPLALALGRVLAEDQHSPVDVPPADNSAMDGFTLNSSDCHSAGETVLMISQCIPAGAVPIPLQSGTAARIFTGAEVPPGADTVVAQEQCRWDEQQVTVPPGIKANSNIRPLGQDIRRGRVVLERGCRLKPQDMGLLASVGIANVPVYRRLKVALLCTGDELVEPGQVLSPGHIYNSNRYTLAGQITSLGFDCLDMGILADDADAIERALLKAAEVADCILTSGGVSVGEEDHVKGCVEKLGNLSLWRLAIKPGKPLAFGDVKGVPFLGLPGNPASVFVTFAIIARPYLLKSQGASDYLPTPIPVIAGFSRPHATKRQEYLRARLVLAADGTARAELSGNQSSGVLSTASAGNGFVIHCLGEAINEHEPVPFLLFSELLF